MAQAVDPGAGWGLRREYLEKGNSGGALVAVLPGGRLHLQHGPIDIVAQAFGEAAAVRAAYARAAARFATVLEELVAELLALRREDAVVSGEIARAMAAAVAPFRPSFVTPMAAVAGAVADAVLATMVGPGIARAYANNGGDIAVFLAPGQVLTCALAGAKGGVQMRAEDRTRGIATSGCGGRSFSFGIADAVTVLARTAAMADAAATMIANAVDLPGHPGVLRRPAKALQADSDLGARLVTVAVPELSAAEAEVALDAGLRVAQGYLARGLIEGAGLFLQGNSVATGVLALPVRENEHV